MTTVGFAESTQYALRLYGYVLATFVPGAVGVGLGATLLWPEFRAWRGPGEAAVAPGVAGGLLLFLGLSVLAVGWLGSVYKLLADAVATGTGDVIDEPSAELDTQPTERPSAGSAAISDRGTGETGQGSDHHDEQPPEPSPSEIAFGNEAGAGDDGGLPGQDGAGDPLSERSE